MGDFNDYYILNDVLSFNERDLSISVNKINNLLDSSILECFVKIIDKYNYIENEIIKTISIIQSNGNSNIKGTVLNGLLIFYINYGISSLDFYSNAYCKIIGENYDIDYLSYNGLIIDESKNFEPITSDNSTFSIIIISAIAFIVLLIIIFIIYVIYKKKKDERIERKYFYSKL